MARRMVVDIEDIDKVGGDEGRKSLNLRIDNAKFAMLEGLRRAGFGLAQTQKNRSDVYNEALGYGIQTMMLRQDLGEKEFDQLWRIINRIDVKKINLERIERMVTKDE